MALHAISVCDMVFNEALKIVNYKSIIKRFKYSEQVTGFTILSFPQ